MAFVEILYKYAGVLYPNDDSHVISGMICWWNSGKANLPLAFIRHLQNIGQNRHATFQRFLNSSVKQNACPDSLNSLFSLFV